jgi:hypothetical protein
MIIDLIGGSYEHKFRDWNAQRTVNWYPKITDQKSQEKNKTQIALFPRPGLSQFVDLGGDTIRGMFTARTLTQERCFAVVGTSLWEITYDGSSTLRGTLTGMSTGSRSKVYMAVNGNSQLMIQDTQAGYIFDMTTNTLTRITDIDYPGGSTLDYADGYFIISDNNVRVSFSALNDGFSWNGFNFFTPTFKTDKVKAIVAFREEIFCFGDETIEVYINDGETPFIRQSRTSMYFGLTARDSIAVHQSGVFFLGKSATGGSEVYMMATNYALTPLSSPAISNRLNTYVNEDAEGFVLSSTDGHIFYHLHLPALKTTLVYDVTTGMWHERQSVRPAYDEDGTRPQDMYRGRNHVTFKGMNLFGDWHSGKIFKEDNTISTDDGNIRLLKRTSSIFQNELKYISVYRLEFDVNSGDGANRTGQGSDPIMMFSCSQDGGNTFQPEELIKLGSLGSYDERVQINNLGTARNWVLSFSISDPVDIIIMQAVANGSFGAY